MTQHRHSLAAASALLLVGFAALADDPPADKPPPPRVRLFYRELLNGTPFPFTLTGKGDFVKPAGALRFEFPEKSFPSDGLDQEFKTYCAEPFVPIVSGKAYPFAVEPFGDPAHFGLPDDDAGRRTAEFRTALIRELFGRFYAETLTDPATANPAFQVALWELIAEPEYPTGPTPFGVFSGAFRTTAAPAEAADFTKRAEEYLAALTGDDSAFANNPDLKDLDLVRLTGLPDGDAAAPESQVTLRRRPSVPAAGSDAPFGGSGTGLGRLAGGGGPAGGGGGGGGGGGFPGGGTTGGGGFTNGPLDPGTGTGNGTGTGGPLNPGDPGDPNPPVVVPPVDPPPVTPPNPVPAPPGVVLGLVAAGAFALRRLAGRASGK